MTTSQRLSELLDGFLADSRCPGAALGVLVDGEITAVAGGVLNLDTGIEATPDSVFQIGSVTKVWTATLILQLVDEGKLELDAPVRTYLPDFAVTDEAAAAGVTIRHLLTHTSGIEGDVFDDVGTNDDCLAKYVEALSGLGTVHGLGETFSYCNSGYVLLGRIIEEVTGSGWDAVLKERLGAALGMEQLGTTAGDAILRRASAGHLAPPGSQDIGVAPMWSLPRALGPAGLVNCSVSDLLRFAKLHLDDGRGPDGTQVLSPDSVKLMREPQVACPEPMLGDAWGLGWILNTWDGRLVAGHGGNTIGQSAYFQTVPDRGVAVALLTNLTGGAKQARELIGALLQELADVQTPPEPAPNDELSLDLEPLVGRYGRYGVSTAIDLVDGALQMTVQGEGEIAEMMGLTDPIVTALRPYERSDEMVRFVTQPPESADDAWTPVTFYGDDGTGRPLFVHAGARVARRAD